MKYIFIILVIFEVNSVISQEKFTSKNTQISFYSSTLIEDISASTSNAVSVIHFGTKKLAFKVLIRSFEFDNKTMQDHFNENYMESGTIPYASFIGMIKNNLDITKKTEGYLQVEGDLTIHGVTKRIATSAYTEVRGDAITTTAKFKINPNDYDIKIPKMVAKSISNSIDVTVKATYDKK